MNIVQKRCDFMNTAVISKEQILKKSRELIKQSGISAMNIRSVASACGVSVGSIYNYFESKADFMGAVVESVWCEIFSHSQANFDDIMSCIDWIYDRMNYANQTYPNFFSLHSLGFMQNEKQDGKKRMDKAWGHIINCLYYVMKNDKNIKENAFDDEFTAEKFAHVLFSLMLSAFFKHDYDPFATKQIAKRILY